MITDINHGYITYKKMDKNDQDDQKDQNDQK